MPLYLRKESLLRFLESFRVIGAEDLCSFILSHTQPERQSALSGPGMVVHGDKKHGNHPHGKFLIAA